MRNLEYQSIYIMTYLEAFFYKKKIKIKKKEPFIKNRFDIPHQSNVKTKKCSIKRNSF